jgi:glycosyltransferase involved in cell wall biosynthesis
LQVIRTARRLRPDVLLFGDFEHRCDAWFVRLLQRAGFCVADIWHNVDAFERTRPGAASVIRHQPWRDQLAAQLDVVFVHGDSLAAELRTKTGRDAIVIPHGNEDLLVQKAGADPDLDKRFGLPPGATVALLFGTITKYKGVPLLLEALAHIPEANRPIALCAGFATDDADIERLKTQAAAAGLDRWMRWDVRYVPLEEVAWYFRRADFVVLPYRAASQSGVAHIALTFATPLIVTDVGALAEATGGGRAGLIVPTEDAPALADAIERLTTDHELRVTLAAEAARLANERGNWDAIAQRVLEALNTHLKENKDLCAVSVDTSAAA